MEDALCHMGKAKIWNEKTKDIKKGALLQRYVGLSAILYRDHCHSRNKEYSCNTQKKATQYQKARKSS